VKKISLWLVSACLVTLLAGGITLFAQQIAPSLYQELH